MMFQRGSDMTVKGETVRAINAAYAQIALTPTALALIALTSSAFATDWKKAKEVSVVTTESKFTPNKLTFRRGIPYKLHVQNRGKEMHEFNAAELLKTVKINNPNVLNADKTELVLRPGEAKDLYFIPRQAGHFKLVCPDHDWAGMTGEITVE